MPVTTHSLPVAARQDFPIVGIGASAGGLDAFRQFFQAIPGKTGMAFVIVQHLDPGHNSILPEILSRFTTLPVHEITDEIHLVPDTVYVIPENKLLTSIDGILKLGARDKSTANHAIDIFFTSLAEVHLNLAVGIILSGNGKDGTAGLKAIKIHGGSTFAQNADASHNDMPGNAILSGMVDHILPASEIPGKLVEVMSGKGKAPYGSTVNEGEDMFRDIIALLNRHSGVDFTYYKQTSIRRRIARRMAISKCHELFDYLEMLKDDKEALDVLFNDLLIPVTEFFRDPNIFRAVQDTVFHELVKDKSASAIRVWVAGCATGEEAYSMAIALHEFLGDNPKGIQIQIFASDISEVSIAKARTGIYRKAQLKNVPENLLKKYFTETGGNYHIKRQIRDLCVFAVHNFLKDPPFAKMDLVSCRNVLIYMDPFLQKKSLTTFHYALKEHGYLLLGKSETTAPAENLFLVLGKGEKLYTRMKASGRSVHAAMTNSQPSSYLSSKKALPGVIENDFKKSAESILLSTYTPASVVVNEQMEIVHIYGQIHNFLEFTQGKPTLNLLKIARDSLAFELRNAWQKAKDTGLTIVRDRIQLTVKGVTKEISIEFRPLRDTASVYFLIVFSETVIPKELHLNNNRTKEQVYLDGNLKRIRQLEGELLQIHEDVNAIAGEHESSNEELQSANEELLSGSEELQTLNEELETSKEELQSSNEELLFTNQELLNKQQQINISKHFTEAVVDTLREPIVVLDIYLRIKDINRAFSKKYNITKQEAEGKLIYEIQNHLFDNSAMRAMLEKILPEKIQLDDYQISVNLLPYGESILLLNARQITNEDVRNQLILLAIEDITERKNIEKTQQLLSDGFESKVKERTADLMNSNNEREIKIKELHEANSQLQQFAYVTSHDLQEPLRKIMVFISKLLVLDEDFSDEALAILNKIKVSSDRMKTLISDLLSYAYLNKSPGEFVSVDMNTLLKNILVDFELLLEEQDVELYIGALPVITSVPMQMNQLLHNLISNALKFRKTDGTAHKIEIKSRTLTPVLLKRHPDLDPGTAYVEIMVRDNGIGFDQRYKDQVFTIFQRLHSTGAYPGTGIGLSICKKIVENHGGIIYSRSAKNEGAAFYVILPVKTGVLE